MKRNTQTRKRILIVDDHPMMREGLALLIDHESDLWVASQADNAAQALSAVATHVLDLVDVDGSSLVRQLNERGRCPPFVIITGQGDERVAVDMMKRGARDYLVKDVDFLQFVPAVVRRALDQVEKERRLAEAEEQVHLIRSVVEQGFSAVLITSAELPDPRIVYINPAFARATGYVAEQVVGRPLSTLASLTGVQERLRAGLPKGASFLEEVSTFQTREGERWGEWRVGPVQDKLGKNTHWLVIFRDITERKRLEKEILEISDQERRRIGQDLHDGLCQHLAGIELMSQVLGQKLARRAKAAAVQAGEIARYVREAIAQTRALARGLAPVTLESEGLTSALLELATTTEKMFKVQCRVECLGPSVVPAAAVATHLYRIAQEAVFNAIKHGGATELFIQVEAAAAAFHLRVLDNGKGLPKAAPSQNGMGLRIMRYRANLIGGQLSVGPNPTGGTTIHCAVPTRSGAAPTNSDFDL